MVAGVRCVAASRAVRSLSSWSLLCDGAVASADGVGGGGVVDAAAAGGATDVGAGGAAGGALAAAVRRGVICGSAAAGGGRSGRGARCCDCSVLAVRAVLAGRRECASSRSYLARAAGLESTANASYTSLNFSAASSSFPRLRSGCLDHTEQPRKRNGTFSAGRI